MEKNSGYQVLAIPAGQSRRQCESSRRRGFGIALIPVLHLISCLALAVSMIYGLNGYNAVPSSSPNKIWGETRFKLRVSDVTTLISAAMTVIKLLVGGWTGTIIWNCIFLLLEGTGLTLAQINRITTYYIPPLFTRRSGRTGPLVMLLLLLVIPQQLISPMITGSVGWSPGFEYNPILTYVQAGNPDSEPRAWDWYFYATRWRRSFVRRAAAYASITWGESVLAPDRSHCRHVTNGGEGVTVNSTLLDATVPCIQIHSITFPRTPVSAGVFSLVRHAAFGGQNDTISRVEEPPYLFLRDGNAVLFDPNDRPGLFEKLPHNETTRAMSRPGDYLHSNQLMTAVVLVNGSAVDDGNNCTGLRESIFGGGGFANIFSPLDPGSGTYYYSMACFTYALVNLTAGVATSASSTYISSRVVEADERNLPIRAGPWVQEAIYLLPDVMSTLTMMNTTELNTWDNLEQYIDRVVRYSYQAAWDMLFRSFDTDTAALPVRVYEQRLVADVSRRRVLAWLIVSLLLPLSSFPLVFWRGTRREVVLDGTVAALLTDPSAVLNDVPDLTDLSYVTKEDDGIGALELRQVMEGRHALFRRRIGAAA